MRRVFEGLKQEGLIGWLTDSDPARLGWLYRRADEVRRRTVGNQVHLRGLIEISNFCSRNCAYCGLRSANRSVNRYRMTADEILERARKARRFGYGTVVLQGGEDYGLGTDWVADVVRRIKSELKLAVTLSLGERSFEDLACWREAGADRYLLRFETSDMELYGRIHPSKDTARSRFAILQELRELGYEVGSGVMVGIPGQTYESLAEDLLWFGRLDLDMIGIGPYIPHPATPLVPARPALLGQVPASEEMVYKMVALTRLMCPDANIPATTALATINTENGRELGLQRGANVVMPNLTPVEYRKMYEIYPGKACISEAAEDCNGCLLGRIASIGRIPGRGPGGRAGTEGLVSLMQ